MSRARDDAPQLTASRRPAAADVPELRRRAALLARVQRRSDERRGGEPALVLNLGEERYAMAAAAVLEVAVLRELTPLPGAAPPLFGITHWRGDVLPIHDVRDLLGVLRRGLTDLARVIVLDTGRHPIGVLADAVRDIIDIDPARVRPVPERDGSIVAGVTDDALLVIDAAALVRSCCE